MATRRQQRTSAKLPPLQPKSDNGHTESANVEVVEAKAEVVEGEMILEENLASAAPIGVSAEEVAELESKIDDLKNALDNAKQKEKKLQITIDQLQTQLYENQALMQSLQKSVEKMNAMQIEFSNAQQAAVRLAETNQKLMDENAVLKAERSQLQSQTRTESKTPQPEPTQPENAALAPPPLSPQQDLVRQRQAAALAHPVFPGSPEQSPIDIGWAD